jgi:O-antigen/teichoic acid export membrane protein
VDSKAKTKVLFLRSYLRYGIVRHTLNYLLSKVVPGVMGLLSVVVFVRMLGYVEYGRYAIVHAIAMAFSSGMAGWLSQGTLRYQSKHSTPADLSSFLRATNIGAALSVLGGGAALGIAFRFSGTHSYETKIVAAGLFAAALVYTVCVSRLQASLSSAAVMRVEAIRAVTAFVVPALLIWLTGKQDHRLLLLGVLAGYAMPIIGRVHTGKVSLKTIATRWSSRLTQREKLFLLEVLRYGSPVAVWLLCQQAMIVADRYIIQMYEGYSAAGIYASLYDVIIRSFSLVFMPITLAVHPLVMHRWNRGPRKGAVSMVQSALRYQFALFLPICAGLFLFRSGISRLIVGTEDPRAAAIVLPLAVAGFLWQTSLLAHKPLEIVCQTKRMLIGVSIALALNIVGDYCLIPIFGYEAAAFVSMAGGLLYLLLVLAFTPRMTLQDEEMPRGGAVREGIPAGSGAMGT